MQELGQWVKELRERRGWSMSKLAILAGISRSYISRLEAGEYHNPSQKTLQGLARAFHVPVEYLIEGGKAQTMTEEDRLLAGYRRLSEEDREEFLETVERRAERRGRRLGERREGQGS